MKTEIAKDIERAGASIRYDAQCKKVLSNKYILAWIMQVAIKEYAHFSHDFIRRCIENEPEVGTVPVESKSDTKENAEKIAGLNTEDKDAEDGWITYDIRFEAYTPKEFGKLKIIINVEAQQKFNPGYPIETRGIYYGARMISSQNGVEFAEPNYGDIKKVYSIWVCMNAPNYIGNAIAIYEIQKTNLYGTVPCARENYDKLTVVKICLNEKARREKGFFDMMNTLLSTNIDVETKKRILQNEYQIPMEQGIVKELSLMCNLSGYVRYVQKEEIIVRLYGKDLLTDEQILEIFDLTEDELQQMKEDNMLIA